MSLAVRGQRNAHDYLASILEYNQR
ncbi:hypothetical protein FRACA_10119 [Frankia canadensis]|uniref:Uncharacterized protein n=1 Tax=Frankia canadensis TaxID=1836972 RepID=A0A2I2KI64_9ACTN|nr:hypothetical protein FRACA_10119 [Frankia canadensis]SOU52650.1 hypothetical protein FRACA_10119 [Frankia canadensis]